MTQSKKFDKILYWYSHDNWTKKMVWDAVLKGWITKEEYIAIVGEEK